MTSVAVQWNFTAFAVNNTGKKEHVDPNTVAVATVINNLGISS